MPESSQNLGSVTVTVVEPFITDFPKIIPIGQNPEYGDIVFAPDPTYWVVGEVPVGNIDGVNSVFTSAVPFHANTVRIFLNGLRLNPNHFIINSTTVITLDDPPFPGDELIMDYIKR